MKRGFVVLGLLVVMPFSGMRVICLDAPTDVSGVNAPVETLSDCERLCPLHQPTDTSSSSKKDEGCALSADASSLIIFASTAVVRPQEPLQVPDVVSTVSPASPRSCVEPELARLDPPPKPQAL